MMNPIAWHFWEGMWLFVIFVLPILLIQAKRAGDEAGAKLVLRVLAVTLLVILIFDPETLIAMIGLPVVLIILFIGWVRRL